jgi:hypothetical protein
MSSAFSLSAFYASLFLRIISLLCLQKFPVPLRREFGHKALNLLGDCKQKSPRAPKICKIPC